MTYVPDDRYVQDGDALFHLVMSGPTGHYGQGWGRPAIGPGYTTVCGLGEEALFVPEDGPYPPGGLTHNDARCATCQADLTPGQLRAYADPGPGFTPDAQPMLVGCIMATAGEWWAAALRGADGYRIGMAERQGIE